LSIKIIKVWAQWLVSLIASTWEVEIRRIMVQGQTRQKVWETPSQQNKPGVVANKCYPSYWEAYVEF
jgi:hypothetical protein